MARRTGGQLVVDTLRGYGVDTVFGIPGVHNLGIYEALREQSAIRHILTRHEQGAAFMADGYARVSGRPGVALVTTGPGALNTLTPLGEAYTDSSPVLVIATNVERRLLETGRGTLHEVKDQPGAFRAVIGQCERAMNAWELAPALQRAWAVLSGSRPRPAALDIPNDVLLEATDMEPPPLPYAVVLEPQVTDIERAATLLRTANRPVIYAGGGVVGDAAHALVVLAERLGAGVVTSSKGKGAIPDDHPLALGYDAGSRSPLSRYMRDCDVVLAVGTRFAGETAWNWQVPCVQGLIRIDADPTELSRSVVPGVGIHADARRALDALVQALGTGMCHADPTIAKLREHVRDAARTSAPWNCAVLDAIRASLPHDGILCVDMTMVGYQATTSFPTYRPRTFLAPRGFGTLGFALPAAIGARAAVPNRPVVALVGDGGFQFSMQEVATAIQHQLSVVILIVNDNSYTAVRRAQERQYGHTMAVHLINPDFQQLAAAYGMPAELVPDPVHLQPALERAYERTGPTLLEIRVPEQDICNASTLPPERLG